MLTIRTNLAAAQAKRDYHASSNRMTKSFEKLSSGFRITKASDDTAGLSVGTNLTAQIQSLKQSTRNAMDGLSALETVEGSLAAGQQLLARLRQLTMQIVSDGVGQDGREMIKREVDVVLEELRRISETTEFNGLKLLNGDVSSLEFQIGIRGDAEDFITLEARDVGLSSLGLHAFLDLFAQQTNNPGSGPERAAHALTYDVHTSGNDLNQVKTFNDATLENGFGAQTITINAADGTTQVINTSVNDTAYEIETALNALEGVTAASENGVKINNFSMFSGATYLRYSDGTTSGQLDISGKTLAQISSAINAASNFQGVGITSKIDNGELLVYSPQHGYDIQIDATASTDGQAQIVGLYSGSSAVIRDTFTYGVSTLGSTVNRVKTFTDSTLANGYGAQTITFTASSGSTQSHTTSAHDTAKEIANALNGFTGVTASAENAVRINNFSTFSGTTYLRFHDGIGSNSSINIAGKNLSEINSQINGDAALQARGITSRMDSGDLIIEAENGDDIQLDANSASAGQARMTGIYSGNNAMVYNYNTSSINSGTVGGVVRLTHEFGYDITVDSSNNIFNKSNIEADGNWTSSPDSATVGGVVRMALDAGFGIDVDSNNAIFTEGHVQSHANWSKSSAKSSASMADSDLNKNSVGAQTVTISGQYGTAAVAVVEGESAKSIASKIDAKYLQTGVNATARTDVTMSGLSHNGTVSFTLAGNGGTTVSISAAVTTGDLSNLVSDINSNTGTTGISASLDANNSSVLRMVHESGVDIRITNFAHSTATLHTDPAQAALRTMNVGPGSSNSPISSGVVLSDGGNALQDQMNGTVIGGEISFSSGKDFELSSTLGGGTPSTFAGEAPGSLFNTAAGVSVSGSVQIQSNTSLNLVDDALTIVSDLRAKYGAAQNRLMSVMTTIDTSMDSLSAGRARVMDADVATEVANVSSNQVLQQAGATILNSSYDFTGHALRLLDK